MGVVLMGLFYIPKFKIITLVSVNFTLTLEMLHSFNCSHQWQTEANVIKTIRCVFRHLDSMNTDCVYADRQELLM